MSADELEQSAVNSLLTALVAGAADPQPDVRLSALQALRNALQFADTNFKVKAERDYVMQVVGAGAAAPEERVRQQAYECLVEICAGADSRTLASPFGAS